MPDDVILFDLMKPEAVLFDWDGTLVDSHPVLAAAMNVTLEHYGRSPWTYEEWEAWLGLSARDAFPKEFGERWEEAREIYLNAYENLHLSQVKALQNAQQILQSLSKADIPMGVVSNKTGDYLRKEITHFEWQDYFGAAVGSGDTARDKPAPEPVYDALNAIRVKPGPGVWFIGDNDVDVACGQASKSTTVLIGNGFPHSNPDHRVTDLEAFGKLIQSTL